MLTLSGLKNFYFLPNFHDMRCKAPRVAEIVRNRITKDMEIDELTQRVLHQKRMEELESKPAAPYDPSEGMTTMEELRGYIRFLYGQYMEEKEQNRQQQASMQESLYEMARQLKEANEKVLKLTRELQTANDRLGVLNSEHFGTSKSLKGTGKNKVTKGKNDGRDDMGGKASVNNGGGQPQPTETEDASKRTSEGYELGHLPSEPYQLGRQGSGTAKQTDTCFESFALIQSI